MATHCSILAWRIAWTEDPNGLQSTGSQKGQTRLRTHACAHVIIYSSRVDNGDK